MLSNEEYEKLLEQNKQIFKKLKTYHACFKKKEIFLKKKERRIRNENAKKELLLSNKNIKRLLPEHKIKIYSEKESLKSVEDEIEKLNDNFKNGNVTPNDHKKLISLEENKKEKIIINLRNLRDDFSPFCVKHNTYQELDKSCTCNSYITYCNWCSFVKFGYGCSKCNGY